MFCTVFEYLQEAIIMTGLIVTQPCALLKRCEDIYVTVSYYLPENVYSFFLYQYVMYKMCMLYLFVYIPHYCI